MEFEQHALGSPPLTCRLSLNSVSSLSRAVLFVPVLDTLPLRCSSVKVTRGDKVILVKKTEEELVTTTSNAIPVTTIVTFLGNSLLSWRYSLQLLQKSS